MYNELATSSATATTRLTGWRLPSVTDWRYVIAGLGGLAYPSATLPEGVAIGYHYGTAESICDAINAACGNVNLKKDMFYWSSSQYENTSDKVWVFRFYEAYTPENGSNPYGEFFMNYVSNARIRPVFAY